MRTLNEDEGRTPPSSHLLPMRQRNEYLNIMPIHTGRRDKCKGGRKKILPGGCAVGACEGGDFFFSGEALPLCLSVPQPVTLLYVWV